MLSFTGALAGAGAFFSKLLFVIFPNKSRGLGVLLAGAAALVLVAVPVLNIPLITLALLFTTLPFFSKDVVLPIAS